MPLKYTDLPMLSAPVFKGTAAAGATAAIANVLQAQQQREMARYHDILKAQEDRRMDSVEAGQRALNEEKKRKMALEIMKARADEARSQQDAREKTILDAQKLSLVDPMSAQALLANRGMLAQPAPQPAIPQQPTPAPQVEQPAPPPMPQMRLPQAAVDAGISQEQIAADIEPLRQMRTGFEPPAPAPTVQAAGQEFYGDRAEQEPDDTYTVMSGGQEFKFSKKKEIDQRTKAVEDLFSELVKNAPEKNEEVAKQVLAMAPKAVMATGGDTGKASKMLLDLYVRTVPKDGKKKKGVGGGVRLAGDKPSAGKKGIEMYKFGYNKAESFLSKNKYFEQIKALEDVQLAKSKLIKGGATDHKEAIILMARALQGGRLTDKDIEIAEGFKSLRQEVERFFSIAANKEAKLPESMMKPILRALNNTMLSKYDNIRTLLNGLKDKRSAATFKEEAEGVDTYLVPELERWKDIMGGGGKRETPQKSSTLDRLESKYNAGK